MTKNKPKFLIFNKRGNFNGDGIGDLAVGVPEEDLGNIVDAGAINIIYGYGSASGLTVTGNQFLHQDSSGIEDVAENSDFFGVLAVPGRAWVRGKTGGPYLEERRGTGLTPAPLSAN